MSTVSRRSFLRSAAAGAAVLGLAGAGVAFADEAEEAVEGEEAAAEEAAEDEEAAAEESSSTPMMSFSNSGYDPEDYPDPSSWRTAPDPITDDQCAEEYTADVIIVGEGHYGITCARYLCDNSDKSVIVIEMQDESSFAPLGNEWTQLNSEFGFTYAGFDYYDPVEFQQNWMTLTGNQPNPKLIMNYAQYSGAATDMYLQDLTEDDIATITYNFNDYRDVMLSEMGPIKFYTSCISPYGTCNESAIHAYNREACIAKGAQWFFSTKGEQLITDDEGAVIGVYAQNTSDETYIRFNANVAVVLATGGFGGNGNMCLDLLTDLTDAFVDGEQISVMLDRDGSGIQMGYWAGGRIQAGSIATMNGKHASPGNPQNIWLDENGLRYTNEYVGSVEFRGRPTASMPRDTFYIVYDSTYPDLMVNCLPTHNASEPTESSIESARTAIETAYAAGAEGSGGTYAADTLEEVFTYVGMSDEVKANALSEIEKWNQYCEEGADQEFGRWSNTLWPISTPPYVCKTASASIGTLMCTNGGLETDGNCRVVGADYRPIQGLFAGGNCGGNRFGYDYFTPGPGVSIGTCLTLGYCTGKYIAENM